MKTIAAVLHEMETPLPYVDSQPIVIEELEREGPGKGEVLVEVKGAGLCHSDLSVINGSRPRQMPMVLGHEAAGIIAEVGPEVTRFKKDKKTRTYTENEWVECLNYYVKDHDNQLLTRYAESILSMKKRG